MPGPSVHHPAHNPHSTSPSPMSPWAMEAKNSVVKIHQDLKNHAIHDTLTWQIVFFNAIVVGRRSSSGPRSATKRTRLRGKWRRGQRMCACFMVTTTSGRNKTFQNKKFSRTRTKTRTRTRTTTATATATTTTTCESSRP